MQTTSLPTLQQAQTNAILQLLNLNEPPEASTDGALTSKSGSKTSPTLPTGPPVWKVLVLDQRTKDVLATVLRVQDLRDVGVTLHVSVLHRSSLPNTAHSYASDNCTQYDPLYQMFLLFTSSLLPSPIYGGLQRISRKGFTSPTI